MAPGIEKFEINKPNLTTFKYKFEQEFLIINLKALFPKMKIPFEFHAVQSDPINQVISHLLRIRQGGIPNASFCPVLLMVRSRCSPISSLICHLFATKCN